MNLRMSAVTVAVLFLSSLLCAQTPILKVDDVRAGMKGVMKTVFQGTQIEDVQVEVVDVLHRARTGMDLVIIRLEGEKIRYTGVAQGMSGSPVYIEGKLVGAVSYTWRFMKDPMAGVTPIEAMTAVWNADEAKPPAVAPAATWAAGSMLPLDRLVDEMLSPRPAYPTVVPASLRTLDTPVSVSGLPRGAMRDLADRLRAFDVQLVEGGATGRAADGAAPADLKLAPGSALCIQLVRGDLEAAGVGTVTHVAGSRFYGFGHPMFNNGAVRLPVATGTIGGIVPSAELAFKLGSPVKTVGTLYVDQGAAVAGEVGPLPEMLQMAVEIRRRDVAGDGLYRFEVVKDPRMMLTFANAAINGSLTSAGQLNPEATVKVNATVEVEGFAPLEIEEFLGGPQAPADATGIVLVPLGTIVNNPYAKVNVKSVKVRAEVLPGDPRAIVRWAETNKTEYRPGEEVDLAVTIQPWRGKDVVRHCKLAVPVDAPEGPLAIVVCDSVTDERLEQREAPHRFKPDDVKGILDFFRRPRPNTDLVVRLSRETGGMAIKGRELPNLPDSVVSVLGKQPPTDVSPFTTPVVRREPTEFFLVGMQQVQIMVKK